MQSGRTQPKRGQRISTTLLVASCALVMPLLLCASFCGLGANYQGQLGLLEPYRAPTIDEATAVIPIEYAIDEHEPNDVVFVGDSTCRTGLDPRLFQKLSGLTAYNLGSSGRLSIWGQFATLTAYLAHHPAPRAVVLCMSPVDVLQIQRAPRDRPLQPRRWSRRRPPNSQLSQGHPRRRDHLVAVFHQPRHVDRPRATGRVREWPSSRSSGRSAAWLRVRNLSHAPRQDATIPRIFPAAENSRGCRGSFGCVSRTAFRKLLDGRWRAGIRRAGPDARISSGHSPGPAFARSGSLGQ
jgi:hypothetical protein